MKNATSIKVLIFLLLLTVLLACFNWFYHEQDSNEQIVTAHVPTSVDRTEVLPVDLTAQVVLIESPQADTVLKRHSVKLDYDADWCIAAVELTQEDHDYYIQELNSWYVAIGQIRPLDASGYGSARSQYLLPYMEATYDDLLRQIKADDTFAMISALYRQDFSVKNQRRIAQRLIVKGKTSVSLSRLVMLHLVKAKTIFKEVKAPNDDIERSLYWALAYTAYGIEHYDLDVVLTYLHIVSSADFPIELKAAYLWNENDKVSGYIEKLKQLVNQSRERKNLRSVEDNEIPAVAKHDFEHTLAYLHRVYASELDMLKTVLPAGVEGMLEKSACVQQHIDFFNARLR